MIGRAEDLIKLAVALGEAPLLTLVGPAGIGKTTLALRLSHHMAPAFPQGVAFIDLGALSEPGLIYQTIAVASGDKRGTSNSFENLVRELEGRRLLLILDGCEHLIATVADVAERLLAHLPDLVILATSRESLRIDGEGVYRLFPLDCPPAARAGLSLDEVMRYPAAQLLIERVRSVSVGHRLSQDDVPGIIEICRKLDGIPLALELAAGCVASCGIRHTAQQLEGHVHLLWKGRRTAPPRHQTLAAALDWSYDLLSESERRVLRRVSVFVGGFTLDAAQFLVGAQDVSPAMVAQLLGDLVAKSLIGLQESGATLCLYRLLDTTVAYAFSKLLAAGEAEATLLRHADHLRQAIPGIRQQAPSPEPSAGCHGDQMLTIGAVLPSSFSTGQDHHLAIALAWGRAEKEKAFCMPQSGDIDADVPMCHRLSFAALAKDAPLPSEEGTSLRSAVPNKMAILDNNSMIRRV